MRYWTLMKDSKEKSTEAYTKALKDFEDSYKTPS